MSLNNLVIFIKNPVSGKVKTRLAKTLGNDKALEIYKYLLKKTKELSLKLNVEKHLFYSDYCDYDDEWENDIFRKYVQTHRDLGSRMNHAFNTIFEFYEKSDAHIIIIGSDCPELSIDILEKAYDAIHHFDIVLGPANDGGYYLLGLKEHHAFLFESIEWSTPNVLKQTLQKAQDRNFSVFLLPALNDIDTEDDWIKYQVQNNKKLE